MVCPIVLYAKVDVGLLASGVPLAYASILRSDLVSLSSALYSLIGNLFQFDFQPGVRAAG